MFESINATATTRAWDNTKRRQYYANHAEVERARRVIYREKHPEKVRQWQAKADAKRAEKRRADARRRHAENPEKHRAAVKAWAKAHPKAVQAIHHRRKALKRGATKSDFTKEQRELVFQHYGCRCQYCLKKFPAQKLTIDHITPLSKQGDDTLQNVIVSCGPCNFKKGTGPVPKPVQPLLL